MPLFVMMGLPQRQQRAHHFMREVRVTIRGPRQGEGMAFKAGPHTQR